MSKKATAKAGRLVWVEPNKMDSVSDTGTFDYEDYCICVDLEVKIPKRSACGTEDRVFTFHTNHETGNDKISFFTGTDGYLTTSFTDITANDPTSNKETLGVSSINITYNSYFYPQVTINFIDVRGSSLMYPQEDMFKNNTQGSFFKALFCFPYPQFTLKVKGFYGKQVQYDLSVEDFRTSFNPETGNFECTVKFIGYMYGIYTDLPMSYLLVAPYCKFERYSGVDYWEQMTKNGIFVYDNGQPIDTFTQLYSKIGKAERAIQKTLQSNDLVANKQKLEEEKNLLTEIDILFSRLINTIRQSGKYHVSYGNEEMILCSEKDISISKEIVAAWGLLNNSIVQYRGSYDTPFPFIGGLTKIVTDDLANEITEKITKGEFVNKGEGILNEITESNIKTDLEFLKGKKLALGVKFQMNNFLKTITDRKKSISEEITETTKEIEIKTQSLFSEELGFAPSLKNIFRIIFAHLDTFMHIYYSVLNDILYDDVNRSTEKLELTNNNSDLIEKENKVPPFPLVTENNGKGGQETIWPGNYNPAKDMIELRFTEELLKAVKSINMSKKISDENNFVGSDEDNTQVFLPPKNGYTRNFNTDVHIIPTSYSDFTYFNNPYSFFYDKTYLTQENFFTSVGYRLMMPMVGGKRKKKMKHYAETKGVLEAINFYKFVNKLNKTNASELEFITLLNNSQSEVDLNKLCDDFVNHIKSNTSFPNITSTEIPLSFENVENIDNAVFLNGKNFNLHEIGFDGITFFHDLYYRITKNNPFDENQKKEYDLFYDGIHIPKITELPEDTEEYANLICNFLLFDERVNVRKGYLNTHYNNLINGLYTKLTENKIEFTVHRVASISENTDYNRTNLVSIQSLMDDGNGIVDSSYDAVLRGLKYSDSNFPPFVLNPSTNNLQTCIYGEKIFYLQNEIEDERCKNLAKAYLFLEWCSPLAGEDIDMSKIRVLPRWYLLLLGARIWRESEEKEVINIGKRTGYKLPNKGYPMQVQVSRNGENWIEACISTKKNYLNKKLSVSFFNENDKEFLRDMFVNWANDNTNGFLKINNDLELKGKDGNTLKGEDFDSLLKELKKLQKKEDKNFLLCKDIKGKVNLSTDTLETYMALYCQIDDAIRLALSPSEFRISKHLFNYKFDLMIYSPLVIKEQSVTEEDLRIGFKSFVKKLHTLYVNNGGFVDVLSTDNVGTATDLNIANTDLKLSLYLTLKSLYDRWLCGMKRDRWNYNYYGTMPSDDFDLQSKYEECEFNKFYFIDSFYNDISSKISFNLNMLKELINSAITNRIGDDSTMTNGMKFQGISCYEFMASVLQKNSMNFLAVPCFNTYKTEKEIKDLFTPFSWFDRGKPMGTSYVGIYPHQVSAHLDIQGGTDYQYPNDGWDIADVNGDFKDIEIPDLIDTENGFTMPAFGVTYAKQDQSYFKKVTVNMDKPQVTEYSIGATMDIANKYGDNQKIQTFVGQDLYKVYSNHSYTCTVEMMGNAMITPLMYFQLNNIPMFRGAYMIIKVEHGITQGNMTTTFTGVRMSKNKIPYVNPVLEGKMPEDITLDSAPSDSTTVNDNVVSNPVEQLTENNESIETDVRDTENIENEVNRFIEAAREGFNKGYKENPNGSNKVPLPEDMPIQGLVDSQGNGYSWCAIFVAWCSEMADLNPNIINGPDWYKGPNWTNSYCVSCTGIYNYYLKLNRIITLSEENKINNPPQMGDLILFNKNKTDGIYTSNNQYGHVGIVEGFNSETGVITYIHGNTSDKIKRSTINYSNSKNYIGCFARPPFGTKNKPKKSPQTSPIPPQKGPSDTNKNTGDIILKTRAEKINFIKACIWHESGNKNNAHGDKHMAQQAYGILQIRMPMFNEINRLRGLAKNKRLGNKLDDSLKNNLSKLTRDDQVHGFISVMEFINASQQKTYIVDASITKTPESIPWSMEYCCAKWNGAQKGKPRKPLSEKYFKDVKAKYEKIMQGTNEFPKGDAGSWNADDSFNAFFSANV